MEKNIKSKEKVNEKKANTIVKKENKVKEKSIAKNVGKTKIKTNAKIEKTVKSEKKSKNIKNENNAIVKIPENSLVSQEGFSFKKNNSIRRN